MGFFVTTKSAVIIVVLFVSICVIVGLCAGLVGKDGGSEESQNDPTIQPAEPTTATPEPGTTEPAEQGPWTNPLLPDTAKPIHYELYLNPDFYYDGSTYEGTVDIEIEVLKKTKYLLVHYKMMTISQTTVKKPDGTDLDISRAFGYDANQFWVTELEDELEAGSTVFLYLEFNSSLTNGIVGFYRSTYINTITKQESWLATSKFQPTDARKAFPNFDEPKYKAEFTVTMRHWKNFTALGNMDVETVTPEDDVWQRTTFQRSYPMSTYLVCFIVCDFEYKSMTLNNGKQHRVWATPDKMDQVNYALELGTAVTNFFEEEFNMTYHLPKLDQVAIPDFSSGAMEHWGLVTYRETSLLWNETLASSAAKERVALVVSHELSHNYFGNIITCRWWDEIWLNEGFARFYQYMGIQDYHPEWLVDDYFVVRTQQGVMTTDAGASSRPVVVKLTSPDDISQAFDGITYDKGGSILRMIESFMGKDRFRDAIRLYLRRHENGSVVTQDLWNALQEVMGDEMNVAEVMDPWLRQMGLPVVTIEPQEGGDIKATPTRFLQDPELDATLPESPYEYKWYVPLSYRFDTGDNDVGLKWLNKSESTFGDPKEESSPYLKYNVRQTGFYRVLYPEDHWREFASTLKSDHSIFEPIDRSNLVDDALNLARAQKLKYDLVLDLTTYMEEETHYFPWRSAYSAFTYIGNMLYGEDGYDLWRRYALDLSSAVMDYLQVDVPEIDLQTHFDNMLRSYIISLACNNGNTGCLNNCSNIFIDWIDDETYYVDPNIRQEVYVYGMREEGGEAEWNLMWSRYEESESAQEKLYLLKGLSQAPQLYLLQRYLDYCMDESKVRSQDFFTAVNYAASNPYGELYVWNWAQQVYDELIERFGTENRYFGRMVPSLVTGFKTEFQLRQVEAFFEKYPEAGAGATPRAQALESIRNNIKWKENNQDDILDFLRKKYPVE